MSAKKNGSQIDVGAHDGLSGYDDAKAIALEIAKRESLHEDLVFADAMHVAVALALETDDIPYSKANAAWMLHRIFPEEVHEILAIRLRFPGEYEQLPMAGQTERLNAAEVETATELAKTLTHAELDAFFLSDQVGRS